MYAEFTYFNVFYTFRAFGLEKFPFKEWILVDLDFSQLNIPVCNESQYTTWIPTDEVCTILCRLNCIAINTG